jgi:hypothetical protein
LGVPSCGLRQSTVTVSVLRKSWSWRSWHCPPPQRVSHQWALCCHVRHRQTWRSAVPEALVAASRSRWAGGDWN